VSEPAANAQQFVIRLSMMGAATTMAFQVAGKAARDALFLTHYRPSQLPLLVVVAALTAIVLSLLQGRILNRLSPARFVPALLLFSAGLQTVEWFTWGYRPGWSAIAVYIHVVALGALITSGFWSVINEQFDPWTAKQAFGRIAGAGTAGGVAGGFLAERLAAMAPAQSVLLAMATMQVLTSFCLLMLPAPEPLTQTRHVIHIRPWDLLRNSNYFRQLSLLVLAGTFSAALLDYVLKADARHTLGPGEPLLRFFAMFHTGTAILSFILQLGATSTLLNKLGLGATVATLPGSVSLGGVIAAITGGLPAVTAARAAEAVVRGSFFRAGYELLYTPMLPSEKRVIKSFNDVTVDRLGDALGGGFAQLAINLGPALSGPVMLVTASVASAGGWLLSRTLNRGYLHSLERSLEHYSDEEPSPLAQFDTAQFPAVPTAATAKTGSAASPEDQFDILASSDRSAMARLLDGPVLLDRSLIPYVVPLLADAALRRPATHALKLAAADHTGQLTDYLLDRSEPLDVRRRVPGILAAAGSARAADALVAALHDPDIGVRISCGRALDQLRTQADIPVGTEPIFAAIRAELRGSRMKQKLSLEHIFVLLAVVLSRDHIRIAHDALVNGQDHLRGIAREYLETSLPPDLADALLEALKPERATLQQ